MTIQIDKEPFDSLLRRAIARPPARTATIKSEKKGATIIVPKPAPAKQ